MNSVHMKQNLDVQQLLVLQIELNKRKKSKAIMYLLWWFTSPLGGHRYYLGDIGQGVVMTLLSLTVAGLIITLPWAIIDIFLIGDRLEQHTSNLELEILQNLSLYRKNESTEEVSFA